MSNILWYSAGEVSRRDFPDAIPSLFRRTVGSPIWMRICSQVVATWSALERSHLKNVTVLAVLVELVPSKVV